MIMYHLGPQLGVWIMQVSTFTSVLINYQVPLYTHSQSIINKLPITSPTVMSSGIRGNADTDILLKGFAPLTCINA